jgi:hypothetical protein
MQVLVHPAAAPRHRVATLHRVAHALTTVAKAAMSSVVTKAVMMPPALKVYATRNRVLKVGLTTGATTALHVNQPPVAIAVREAIAMSCHATSTP